MPFSEIIGHKRQVAYLERAIKIGKTAHAYVFLGTQGIGKRTVAERLIGAYLNVDPTALATHTDVLVVSRLADAEGTELKKQIGLEQIRTVIDRLALSALGGQKAVIIEDADALTVQAQNALLKTLEEPNGQSLIIFLAESRNSLLPTILSRSVPVTFSRVPMQELVTGLQERGYTEDIATKAADLSLGSPGLALQLADADKLMELDKERLDMDSFLALPAFAKLNTLASWIKKSEAKGEQKDRWLLQLCEALHERMLTDTAQRQVWVRALQALLTARQAVKRNVNSLLAFEQIILTLP